MKNGGPLQPATAIPKSGKEIREMALAIDVSLEDVRAALADSNQNDRIFMNDVYQVCRRDLGTFIHLSIKRIDKEPVRDWRDMQEIKNELAGPEMEGLELYPAESRLVDTANQYHLWVLKDGAIPVGFTQRLVSDNEGGGTKQRPR